MWWYGRGNSGDSWLPEEKKANIGTEGERVVAHGSLPSPALNAVELSFGRHFFKKIMILVSVDGTASITSSDK